MLTATISLTPSGEGTRERCIEPIILHKMGNIEDLELLRLVALQHLHLIGAINTPPVNH